MIEVAALMVVVLSAPRWFPSAMVVAGVLALLATLILFFAICVSYLPMAL